MAPEARMTTISIGASTIPGIPSKKNPFPKRYRCPLSRIISQIYITNVTTAADTPGNHTESIGFLLKVNDAIYMPTVKPNKTKNMLINTADNAETLMSPFL